MSPSSLRRGVLGIRMMERLLITTVLLLGASSLGGCQGAATKEPPDTRKRSEPSGPPSTQTIDGSIERGVEFLLKVQNKNGSWGSAHNTKNLNIYAPVPGAHHAFRTAVTSMCQRGSPYRPSVKPCLPM